MCIGFTCDMTHQSHQLWALAKCLRKLNYLIACCTACILRGHMAVITKLSTHYILTESTISSLWHSIASRPSPKFSPQLQNKICELPGNEATFPLLNINILLEGLLERILNCYIWECSLHSICQLCLVWVARCSKFTITIFLLHTA